MSSPRQIPLHELADFLTNLLATLQQQGIPPEHLAARVLPAIDLRCSACNLPLSPADIQQAGHPEAEAPSAKTQRLRQGYCGRNGCDSRFYALTLTPVAGMDWSRVLAEMSQPRPNPAPAPESPRLPWWRPLLSRRSIKIACGLFLLALLLLARHWMNGGSIPLLRPEERFEGAPPEHTLAGGRCARCGQIHSP